MFDAVKTSPHWRSPVLWLALAALLGLVTLAWNTHDRLQSLETKVARRIGEFDAAGKEARAAAAAANAALGDLNRRLASLEARALETQNQQLALNAMYQELARSADEKVVADIEQTLLLARQQLQLAGNVKAALIGMEAALARLRQLGKPQFAELEKAIAQDAARLKLLPAADLIGLNARLESLITAADTLKPEWEAEPALPPAPAKQSGAADTLARLGQEAWHEFKNLVRIRRLDHPELPLLTPSQAYFLSQNLKMRLLSARLAALQRDELGFRADLGAASDWVKRYFNRKDAASVAFLAGIEELRRLPVAQQDAQIDASLKAARAARSHRP